jgi:septal ring factor EnvC (AmiA/AmiB activator)
MTRPAKNISSARLDRIESDVFELKTEIQDIRGRVDELEAGFAELQLRIADLSVRMIDLSVVLDRRDQTMTHILRRLELVEHPH